jgi:hypothetical protein
MVFIFEIDVNLLYCTRTGICTRETFQILEMCQIVNAHDAIDDTGTLELVLKACHMSLQFLILSLY